MKKVIHSLPCPSPATFHKESHRDGKQTAIWLGRKNVWSVCPYKNSKTSPGALILREAWEVISFAKLVYFFGITTSLIYEISDAVRYFQVKL